MKKSHKLSEKLIKKIIALKRRKHNPIMHDVHREHKISYKTLLYMKEYGPKSNVYHVIIKESFKVLILASLISTMGGFGLQTVNDKFIAVLPLIVLMPALNNMIGGYGTIVSSKFTTLLYAKKIRGKWWQSEYTHQLFVTILIISLITAVYIGVLSSAIAYIRGFQTTLEIFLKVLQISLLATVLLIGLIFTLSITAGLHFYKRGEDPNNFLIPITTSIADFGSMLIFFVMVTLLF